MKKNGLVLFLMLIILAACEGPEGPVGPPGEGTNWHVEFIDVRDSEWQVVHDVDGSYYKCEKRLSQLSDYVYEWGTTLGYEFIRYGTNNEVQTLMPFVLDLIEGNDYTWTETTYFDYGIGYVTFYVQYSDMVTEFSPGDRHFRIVLNW